MRFCLRFWPSLACILLGTVLFSQGMAADELEARDKVLLQLEARGLAEGYDEEKDLFIFVGTCDRDMPDIQGADFCKERNRMCKLALFDAKQSLLKTLLSDVRVRESVLLEDKGEETVQTSTSVIDVFAKAMVRGCTVECLSESYAGGVYHVAIAIAWGRKTEDAAVAMLSGEGKIPSEEEEAAAWNEWVLKQDFSSMADTARFVDGNGVFRCAGIGIVDITGKTGKSVDRLAETLARRNLAYALYEPTAVHDHAVTALRETAQKGQQETTVSESFLSRVEQSCNKYFLSRKVYTGKVTHPPTGKTFYVYVAGVSPKTAADLNLIPCLDSP